MGHGLKEIYVKRFLAKLSTPDSNGCINWPNIHAGARYGQMSISGRKEGSIRDSSHRIAWRIYHNSLIPEGYYVCHSCDNTKCCNHNHLFLGLPKDNSMDMVNKGRSRQGNVSKFSESDLNNMRHLDSSGVKRQDIAIQFGCSPSRITQLIGKKTKV